jgi:hypothetical protein
LNCSRVQGGGQGKHKFLEKGSTGMQPRNHSPPPESPRKKIRIFETKIQDQKQKQIQIQNQKQLQKQMQIKIQKKNQNQIQKQKQI